MRRVHVAGVGMTLFGKDPTTTLKKLVVRAVDDALTDARLDVGDIKAAYFGSAIAGSITGQEMIPGQVFLGEAGISGIPIVNVENACASASTAFHLAWQAVATGQADIALAVGAEKMTGVSKEITFAAVERAVDVENAGSPGPASSEGSQRSRGLDPYAQSALKLMERWGAREADFAAIAAKNHSVGAHNPRAQYGAEMSPDDVLSSREVIWPLTLLMCCPISDGASAAVLVSSSVAKSIDRTSPYVRSSILLSGSSNTQTGAQPKAARIAAERAYEAANITPKELSCVELHDAAAPAEMEAYETLGLASSMKEAIRLVRDGETSLGGRIPVNTSGGLLARGHPIGATGIAQICEVVWQLRGEAGPRQVDDARVALTHNTGGWLHADNAAVAVHILSQ